VPKLQAVKNIISHPENFNIALPKVENLPYFVCVDKTRDIDVRVAAQLAQLTVTEFKELNPQFNRPVITGNAETKILLPAENVEIYKNNLSKWEGPLSTWTAYTVGKNERIESIAHRVGASAAVLKDVNQVSGNMLVKAGSTLLIPKTGHAADNDISPLVVEHASLSMARDNVRKINVTASKSDTLNSIAKRYRVSSEQLKDWNNLKSDSLKSGQKIQIEVAAAPIKRNNARVAVLAAPRKSIALNKRVKKITVAEAKTSKKPG
jgi:membrane-bound lytic murein transglycosylase D